MSFLNLKKQHSGSSSVDSLLKQIEKTKSGGYEDPRFYKPKTDANKNAYVKIRFLPEVEGEDSAFVKVFNHSFKTDEGQWYIENCRTTLGDECLVCKENGKLYRSNTEVNKKEASKRGRRTRYISNILVIEDDITPDNNGKVFLFSYGKKIFDKISQRAQPEFKDVTPCDVFSPWDGADFKLKIRQVDGQTNYDSSEFDTPAPLFGGDDAKIENIWKQQHKLMPFTEEGNFKPREELDRRFKTLYPEVYGKVEATAPSSPTSVPDRIATAQRLADSVQQPVENSVPEVSDGEDDDSMEYYKSLLG